MIGSRYFKAFFFGVCQLPEIFCLCLLLLQAVACFFDGQAAAFTDTLCRPGRSVKRIAFRVFGFFLAVRIVNVRGRSPVKKSLEFPLFSD